MENYGEKVQTLKNTLQMMMPIIQVIMKTPMRKSTIYIIEAYRLDEVMPNIIKLKGSHLKRIFVCKRYHISSSLCFHKVNQRNNLNKYFLSELMLYILFLDEEAEFRPDNPGFIQDLYLNKR